jgi:hypothetical protein
MNKSKKVQITKSDMPSLKTQKADIVALLVRSGLGVVPYTGTLLSELVVTIIPNQRVNRIVKFANILESRLSDNEKLLLDLQFKNEEFIGIIEELISQVAKSTSDERRKYLASIIAIGLSIKEIKQNETRRILSLLSELNDAEIIMLRFYLIRTINSDKKFREKHKNIVACYEPALSASQKEKDRYAVVENYKEHLISLGLLKNEYNLVNETGLQEIDTFNNAPRITGRILTGMGRLFLRYIELADK